MSMDQPQRGHISTTSMLSFLQICDPTLCFGRQRPASARKACRGVAWGAHGSAAAYKRLTCCMAYVRQCCVTQKAIAAGRASVSLGLDIGDTTTSELGLSGCRTTEMRWSPRWLLVHSWSERRGSTSRSGALGSSASKKRELVVMEEPVAAPELDLPS